jgi:uncharacterized membrane protein YkvA (DUF1232 family)
LSQIFGGGDKAERAPDPTRPLRFLLHLPNFVKLYWRLFQDSRVPILPKALVVLAIAYVVSPLDLLPDWTIPLLGELDDIAIVMLALRAFIPLCPRHVVEEHVQRIDEGK